MSICRTLGTHSIAGQLKSLLTPRLKCKTLHYYSLHPFVAKNVGSPGPLEVG